MLEYEFKNYVKFIQKSPESIQVILNTKEFFEVPVNSGYYLIKNENIM